MAAVPPGFDNLVLYLKLNDNTANSVIINEVGTHGTAYGDEGEVDTNTFSIAAAHANLERQFLVEGDEEGGLVFSSVPHYDALSITGDLCFCYWARQKVPATENKDILAKGTSNEVGVGGRSYHLGSVLGSGPTIRPFFYISVDGSGDADKRNYWAGDSGVHNAGTTYFVAINYDNSAQTATLKTGTVGLDNLSYKNFVKTGTAVGTINVASGSDLILWLNNLFGNGWEGDFDEIALYNRQLTDDEMDWVYNGGDGQELGIYHRVYRGQDGNMDYDNVQAVMGIDDSQVQVNDQDLPPNTIWHYIRRQVRPCGLESEDSPALIIAIDENGDMVGSTPNPPDDLTIEKLAGAKFKIRWRYTPTGEEIEPTGFKIYMDSGSGFDFESPDDTIPYMLGRNGEFSWTSGALSHGQMYRFCVRSYRTAAGESQNTNYAADFADSQGPAAITGLQISYQEV